MRNEKVSYLHKILDMFSEGYKLGIGKPEGINWSIEEVPWKGISKEFPHKGRVE